ncbi:MAG: (4Fe-4S)-binding protein [Flavobacteriia bacterium]|nr:(4Fe-4S)-binding protein [Flavobacteriia bacterium]
MKMKETVREYTNGEITVEWRAHLCIHSENCWRGLPTVFRYKQRPWVDLDAEDSETIKAQVHKCPSGALHIKGEERNTEAQTGTVIAKKQPAEVELEADKPYLWCACGRSKDQPFCDNTHNKNDVLPKVIKKEKTEKAWLCQCKQTSNPPYCDGTHNSL